MACSEITQAIQWSQTGTATKLHPVTAYFTKHYGYSATYSTHKDSVQYVVGDVAFVAQPKPHPVGKALKCYTNGSPDEGASLSPSITYDIEIFDDGTLSYLMKINGNPVGGMPPTKVTATCVDNKLLTTVNGSEVVTVGVARKPEVQVPA
jgi:hypothetical protein